MHDLSMRPKPLQQPHPPIWMAALSQETYALCGRYGFNLLCAPVFGFDVEKGVAQIEVWREALQQQGRDPSQHQVDGLIMTYVAETTQQALEDFAAPVLWWYHTLARDFVISVTWEQLVQGGAVVCGSPEQVVQRIGEITEKTGINLHLAWIRIGGLEHQKVLRSMELLSTKVMPQLR